MESVARNKPLHFYWVPDHKGIDGKEIVDGIAKSDAGCHLIVQFCQFLNRQYLLVEISFRFQLRRRLETLQQRDPVFGALKIA